MIIDAWKGMEVYTSDDGLNWSKQESGILELPGKGRDDQAIGGHSEVVANNGRACNFFLRTREEEKTDRPRKEHLKINEV
jgi:hypothetical protein